MQVPCDPGAFSGTGSEGEFEFPGEVSQTIAVRGPQ